MLACTLYIIHQIENRILVPFRNHFIYFRIKFFYWMTEN